MRYRLDGAAGIAGALLAILLVLPAHASANVASGLAGTKPETRGIIDVRRGGGLRGGFRGGGFRGLRGGVVRGWRGNRGWRHGGWRGHRGWRHRPWRRWRRGGIYFGAAPFVYYGSSYASCRWLYRKAVRTGSRYWWRRYDRCRYRYY